VKCGKEMAVTHFRYYPRENDGVNSNSGYVTLSGIQSRSLETRYANQKPPT
jgi:hypothetical protein